MSRIPNPGLIPTRCPYCRDGSDDCPKCLGTGKVAVTIVAGELWTIECEVCGWQNGIKIRDTNGDAHLRWDPSVPPEPGDGGACLLCNRAGRMFWRYVGDIGDNKETT